MAVLRRALLAGAVGLLTAAGGFWPALAKVYLTQEDAIRLAFPPPQSAERRTLYLDEAQARRAADLSGVAVETRIVPYYVGVSAGHVTGYAYFDTHLVRTLQETVLVRLSPEGRIVAIDIVSFDEPEDYKVTPRWLAQFHDQAPEDPKRLPLGIRSLAGATLSARSITDAARRVLALHRLFVQPGTTSPAEPVKP